MAVALIRDACLGSIGLLSDPIDPGLTSVMIDGCTDERAARTAVHWGATWEEVDVV